MSGIAIVAIPAEDDPVWKYSSEKVPHMTLLFLGEGPLSNEENVVQYIQHVADDSLTRFGMNVDHRGTLGPDDADVLFFETEKGFNFDKISAARGFLLANDDIKAAHDSAEQFDGWTPHLTMGFPETPAKPDDREYPGFSYVRFDRLAIWLDNYDGPEFLLKKEDYRNEIMPSAYQSAIGKLADDILSHAKVDTIQDVYDNMDSADQELADLIIGAAVDDVDLSDDESLAEQYDALTSEEKGMINFVAGSSSSDTAEHSGVRGMHWGVRKEDSSGSSKSSSSAPLHKRVSGAKNSHGESGRSIALKNVKSNHASLGEAHLAALKSKGHRVANALLGDKTYWKREGVIVGTTAALVGAALIPGLLPATAVATAIGYTVAAGTTASQANNLNNVVRAIRGNSRISKSHEQLGKAVYNRSTSGSKKVQNILVKNGSIARKNLTVKQSAIESLTNRILSDDELAHFGRLGMKWGVRHPVDSSGRVTGLTSPHGGGKSGGSKDPLDKVIAKARKGKNVSEDHKKLVKDLDKTVSQLSTSDINAINARIKAIGKLKENQAAAKAAKASFPKKLVKFALNSVGQATKKTADEQIQAFTKDFLKGIIPNTKEGKQQQVKTAKEVNDAADKARKETNDPRDHPNYQNQNRGPTTANFDQPSPERQAALETLADQILRQNG